MSLSEVYLTQEDSETASLEDPDNGQDLDNFSVDVVKGCLPGRKRIEHRDILKGMSGHIQPGGCVAILGSSGKRGCLIVRLVILAFLFRGRQDNFIRHFK